MSPVADASQETIVGAIQAYLSLLKDEPDEPNTRLQRLAEALDRLVVEYHRSADVEPDAVDAEAPTIDYAPLAARASASFPELGLYGDVEPQDGLEQEIGSGDAIDDLADIARDLMEVLWHLDHVGVNDAI